MVIATSVDSFAIGAAQFVRKSSTAQIPTPPYGSNLLSDYQ
ncbi:hypothetical protein VCHA40O231_130090 [Vibrio chagasii]|nr:hypothetical protein VCHA40O231_130090 [Vibrio chagasii]